MTINLDDLIRQVEDAARDADPLDRLASAMHVKADVDDLTDSLIGHFVDQARRAGHSWSEIGAAMGVSKQAAQQRHTGDRPFRRGRGGGALFSRFTPRARASVREGEDAARELRHGSVGTEHLLLGLLAVSQGIAGKSLAGMGVTRDEIMARLEPGTEPSPARSGRGRGRHVPFSDGAKEMLQGALEEAIKLNHNYIGTEHLLLALFDVPDGAATRILGELGVTAERARADVLERLASLT